MGFLTGSQTFTRFWCHERLSTGFHEAVAKQIESFGFVETLASRSTEPVIGWVTIGGYSAPVNGSDDWLFGDTIALSVRIDKKAVNGKQFKIRLDDALRATMAEKGLERLSKNHKQEIKEALLEDLLSRQLPSTTIVDLTWNIVTGEVRIFTTSAATLDLVAGLFQRTFGSRLCLDRLQDLVSDGRDMEAFADACANITGDRQLRLPCDETDLNTIDLLEPVQQQVSTEFLRWLWYRSEQDQPFATEEEPFEAWIDDSIRVESQDGDAIVSSSFKGGAPSTRPEGKVALSGSGALLREIRVGLRQGDAEFGLTLKAGRVFGISGVSLPCVVKDGLEPMVYERVFLLDRVQRMVATMFAEFFVIRSGSAWPETERSIAAWVEGEV